MPWEEDDIDAMLADSSDSFTAGDVTAPCILTTHDEPRSDDRVGSVTMLGLSYALVRASMFPGLKTDDAVRVNGVSYRAIPQRVQDGKMLNVLLAKGN